MKLCDFEKDLYFDANASHPLLETVKKELSQAISQDSPFLSNPSSIHKRGQKAKEMIYKLKKLLSEELGVSDPDEFILLSGATEAINTVVYSFVKKNPDQHSLIFSEVEHSAVIESAEKYSKNCLSLKVDQYGQILIPEFEEVVERELSQSKSVLLMLQIANNETGVCFDLDSVLQKVHSWNQKEKRVTVFLDGAQALGKLDPSVIRKALHFSDSASFSAHKIGGPTGVGCLWLHPKCSFDPLLVGGSQEKKRRAGTHNSIGIFGFYWALKEWHEKGEFFRSNMQSLRNTLHEQLKTLPGFVLHGVQKEGQLPQLPNTLNFHFEECPEESLLIALDLEGVSSSSGSACHSGSLRGSHVLEALGIDSLANRSSLRVSLGAETVEEDVQKFFTLLSDKVKHIQKMRVLAREILPDMVEEEK